MPSKQKVACPNHARDTKYMRINPKFLFIILLICVLSFVFLHIFVNIKGKALLTRKLEQTFQRKVEIGSLTTSFPLNLHIKNIDVENLFKIDEIVAGGGLLDLFRSSFNLSLLKVAHPVVNLEKGFPMSVAESYILPRIVPQVAAPQAAPSLPDLNPLMLAGNRFLSSRFSVGRLLVNDGTVNFIDKSVGDKELRIKIEGINLRIDNLNLKSSGFQITSFEFKGKMPWRKGQVEGRLEAEGWFNLAKKDMQATLRIKDIDGIYLYPYYAKWVDLEKARIESAKLQFSSNIASLNNNLTAECHLELTDIVRKPRAPEEYSEKEEKIATVILDTLKILDQGKIILDFTYRTKMDRPEFAFGVIKMSFEDKLNNGLKERKLKVDDVFKFPAKLIEGTVKGASDLSKAAVVGTTSLGRELKDALVAAFKREPK